MVVFYLAARRDLFNCHNENSMFVFGVGEGIAPAV